MSTTKLWVSSPSPPRLHARSQRGTLWSSTEESFSPCWHFSSLLPVFIITREPRSHETRQHPGLPFRSSPWNVLFAMLPGNSLKTRPTKARSTLSRAKQRHSFSLPSLSTLCAASFRKFVQRILSREYSENQGAYFLLQICRDTCRCCAKVTRWIVIARIMT